MPFYPFLGEGSRTKIDYSKKGTLVLTSLLEEDVRQLSGQQHTCPKRMDQIGPFGVSFLSHVESCPRKVNLKFFPSEQDGHPERALFYGFY